jgi:hypothetical protein
MKCSIKFLALLFSEIPHIYKAREQSSHKESIDCYNTFTFSEKAYARTEKYEGIIPIASIAKPPLFIIFQFNVRNNILKRGCPVRAPPFL